MKEGRRRREQEEAGPTKGTKGKRHVPYLVDRPDWERQRLPQQRVVPPPPAAVQGRDAVRQGREEVFEEARGLPTRESENDNDDFSLFFLSLIRKPKPRQQTSIHLPPFPFERLPFGVDSVFSFSIFDLILERESRVFLH